MDLLCFNISEKLYLYFQIIFSTVLIKDILKIFLHIYVQSILKFGILVWRMGALKGNIEPLEDVQKAIMNAALIIISKISKRTKFTDSHYKACLLYSNFQEKLKRRVP